MWRLRARAATRSAAAPARTGISRRPIPVPGPPRRLTHSHYRHDAECRSIPVPVVRGAPFVAFGGQAGDPAVAPSTGHRPPGDGPGAWAGAGSPCGRESARGCWADGRPTCGSPAAGNAAAARDVLFGVSILFSPLTLRGTTFRNRAWVSPMCQYSSTEGRPTDWHLVHLGAFARGGAGLVMTEATAVSPEGRISPWDAGLWSDQQAEDYERIIRFVQHQGAATGVQLGHAGRKGSTARPWEGRGAVPLADGGWVTVAPSPIAYGGWPPPEELTVAGIEAVVGDFRRAAARADAAGFDVVEIHAAHGYLLHQFLSPLTNRRTDAYGGDLEGRSRLLREVVAAVRHSWPERKPLLVRLSATDWADGGWTPEETVAVAR
ncbi:hypothetical protein GHK86_13710, partial [Acidimicrobiaceae bacterium USS-CC1]|nr:hypothetical protein [Acidiferrimicrobium australe]